jgi:predicted permease
MSLFRRISNLFSRSKVDQEIEAELRTHIEMRMEDNLAAGMSPERARRDALLRFGNPTTMKEQSHAVHAALSLESAWRDVMYALRRLRKSPGFTCVALLTLALGIGANTGIFTLLNAVLLKSLPVPDPEQLFLVKRSDRTAETTRFSWSYFDTVRHQLPPSAPVAAMSWPTDFYASSGGEQPQQATGQLVSGEYFQVFETHPVLGRLLTPQDDEKLSGSAVTVISFGYWQRHFGGAPSVLGRKFEINRVPFIVVGVAAQGFFGARAGVEPDFWIPLTMQYDVRYHDHYSSFSAEPLKPWIPQPHILWLQLILRAKDASAVPRLNAILNQQFHDLEGLALIEQDPVERQRLREVHLTLEPGQRGLANLRQEFAQPLMLLMGMAAMVLLIACANIANLLLARAAARHRSFAVQLSMGASRLRLIRQTLIESVLLSAGGGLLGIAVAYWCTSVLPKWAYSGLARIPSGLTPDLGVLAFSLFITVVTGILFGLAPALRSARVDPASVMKGSAESISGERRRGWSLRKILVAGQVAFSLILLVGAAMFLRTLENYSKLDPGFDRDHLMSVHIETHLLNYKSQDFPALYERLTDQIDAIPGVRSASVTTCSLVSGCHDASDVVLDNSHQPGPAQGNAQVNSIALDYFGTVGMHLLQGRAFQTTDNATAPKVAIVSQTFARHYLHGETADGWRFHYPDDISAEFQIVGVVSDARVNDIREAAPPVIYFPIAQNPGNINGLEIRTVGEPKWIAEQIRHAVASVDNRIPIIDVTTLAEEVNENLTQERLVARLTSIFGLLALGLACLGLYGVMSYLVQLRTSEIGVRLALGSPREAVLWLIFRETLWLVTAGGIAGLVLSVAVMHLATSFLFGLSPQDPVMLASAAALLYLVAAVAGFLPARRAASIDPIRALRTE